MLPFHTLDVFTDRPYSGNPLAVVLQADDLNVAQMLAIAREFNQSETIFVQRPRDPAHTARVRIFFPTAEIPFAGHPTIGCAIHLAAAAEGPDVDFDRLVTLEEEAGLVPVRVQRRAGQVLAELVARCCPIGAAPTLTPTCWRRRLGWTARRSASARIVPAPGRAGRAFCSPRSATWTRLAAPGPSNPSGQR